MLREFFQNLQPTLKRYLFSSVCAGLSLTLLIGAVILWLDQRALAQRLQTRTAQGEAVLTALAAGPVLRDTLAQVRKASASITANLVDEPNLAENLWYCYNLEESTRVRLRDLNQLSSQAVAGDATYRLIPYSLRVTGTFPQVMDFMQKLETGPKLAKIRAFSLNRLDAEGLNVSLQIDVVLLGKP
ncbi:MAG: hypothetical protein RLZZ129_215 [Verrucomicrobiota bacterium]|jgi:Tfp pilus assembly protein PilO